MAGISLLAVMRGQYMTKRAVNQVVSRPAPVEQPVVKIKQPQFQPIQSDKLTDIVAAWQKNPRPQYTSIMLKKLTPTIDSAMVSFGGGINQNLRIPAAKLALAALKQYDASKGAAPATHVFHALKRLDRVSNARNSIIKIPQKQRFLFGQANKTMSDMQETLGRTPTLEQLADKMGTSQKKLARLFDANTIATQSSVQNTFQNQDIGGKSAQSDQDVLRYAYASVPAMQKTIMQYRTPIFGRKQLPGIQIAKKLHISPAAVSQHMAHIMQVVGEVKEQL